MTLKDNKEVVNRGRKLNIGILKSPNANLGSVCVTNFDFVQVN